MEKRISIIAAGMGGDSLTLAAAARIEAADLLIGAARLVRPYEGRKPTLCEYRPASIRRIVDAAIVSEIVVLVSGDAGLYSGATGIAAALAEYRPVIYPGISSVAAFSAKIGIPYSDVNIISAHGRSVNIVSEVCRHRTTFVLGGGNLHGLLARLAEFRLDFVQAWVGVNLGTAEEQILYGHPEALAQREFGSLAILAVVNEKWRETAGGRLLDEVIERGAVPMTKEVIREAVVRRLNLKPDAIVYDVGAGTGAATLEIARAAWRGQVYAIERNKEAVDLICRNTVLHRADNVRVIHAAAPEGLRDLPQPDAVFIGGSGGQLSNIIEALLAQRAGTDARRADADAQRADADAQRADANAQRADANAQRADAPRHAPLRVVITAVTLQTLQEAARLLQAHAYDPEVGVEITQIAETRLKRIGGSDMFRPETPIFVLSGTI